MPLAMLAGERHGWARDAVESHAVRAGLYRPPRGAQRRLGVEKGVLPVGRSLGPTCATCTGATAPMEIPPWL